MAKYKTMDGNEACATVSYMFTEVAGIYPITPSSTMSELIDEWSSKGLKNIFNDEVKVIEMQSEAGAAGLIHGSLQSGCLTSTFTSSQGLLLMIPNMYKIAGEMLPGVFNVAARSIATHALSILGDHQDIYAVRMTGVAIIASSSVQQVMDLTAVTYLSAIKASMPFVNFFDGFRTSHEIKKIKLIDKETLIPMVDQEAISRFRKNSLSPFNIVTRGTAQNEDVYFQVTEARNQDYDKLPDTVNEYMKSINQITGEDYKPFNYYGAVDATDVIIAMGSVCDTIREVVDDLNTNAKIGMIEVHLYRPFSSKYLLDILPKTVKRIAVLDRTKEPGSNGEPLYLDIVNALTNEDNRPNIIGGRYGLSSKDTNPAHIKAIYDFMFKEDAFNGFTVGIEDDVTNKSIPISPYEIINKGTIELLIYGYGSDGMSSCSKDLIKIVGDNTNAFVQGYFQYDSKKSGGITRSHLRLSINPIRSSYFIMCPNIVVCSKESYINKYDMLSNLKDGGTFLYVTSIAKDKIIASLPNNIKTLLASKKINFYIIDAYHLAAKYNLKNKISTIIEACLFKISNIIDYDLAYKKMEEAITNRFSKKGLDIVNANLSVIKDIDAYLNKIEVESSWLSLSTNKEEASIYNNEIFNDMNNLSGNNLKVSAFLDHKDGTYLPNTSQYEKRAIAESIPKWIPENCIQCNQCSLVCPHAVIRPFLLSEEEYNNAPSIVKEQCIDAIGNTYKFMIAPSILDCTGCGVCAKTCPGKLGVKALEMIPIENANTDNGSAYLLNKVSIKQDQIKPNIKGSQFAKPLFEYSGACAGCGETPYLKLLTQLFGNHMVIANATGCSSIYGSSFPNTAYGVPWANSLFEDNAEYGYGMLVATNTIRHRLKNVIEANINNGDEETKSLLNEWLLNYDNYEITKKVYDQLDYEKASYLKELKDYLPTRSIWTIGGDGWAYDIGFGGIDQVLSSNDNVNILVLDTQVYSNTGGQSSKASERGSIAKFTSSGKKNAKKDLARIALSYPNVYVASICLGANMQQTLNAMMEAEAHDGPSIIIAYAPCISHGIKDGMGAMIEEQKKAVKCGYVSIFRYNPSTNIFSLDYKEPDFNLYEEFLNNENRFAMLKTINSDKATILLDELKNDAMKRFEYYKSFTKE